jgi:hypothetical protein
MKSTLVRFAPWWLTVLLFAVAPAMAGDLKPFVLGNSAGGDVAAVVEQTKSALQGQGFTVVGGYAPYPGAEVIVVTSDELKAAAAKTPNGGFGAAERVSVTKVGDQVQVAYANPAYTAAAFRMDGDLAAVSSKLAAALGNTQTFGSKDGLSDKDLRKYHYMFSMPYFDDVDELGSFDSHADAVAHIEQRLAAGVGGTKQVFKIDIPGTEQTLFGVGLSEGAGADAKIAETIDTDDLKHTAYLPYALLVNGKEAIALPGKFYIAVSYPDLGMGSFMKISNAPGAIRDALAKVVGKD